MKALYWDGSGLSLNPAHPEPERVPSTALVRVRMAGICATDLQIFQGYMGFVGIPGHEFTGEVVDGSPGLLGKRVVGEINFFCGDCEYCRSQLGRHCPHRTVMGIRGADGSFAQILRIPERNLFTVPDSIPDEEAVFVEPLAAAYEILEQLEIHGRESAWVLGDGKLGALCAQVLRAAGAAVQVIGKHESKLRRIRDLGIPARSLSDSPFARADMVVDATGSETGLRTALELVKPRGKVVLKSTLAAEHSLSLAPLVIDEITVIGSRCGPFRPALEGLEQRHVAVRPLIDRVFPLEQGLEAVSRAGRPGAMKILLRCEGTR